MVGHKTRRILVWTSGLECAKEIMRLVPHHYDVVSVDSIDLATELTGSRRPELLIVSADPRSQSPGTQDDHANRLMQRIFAGQLSVPMIIVSEQTRSPSSPRLDGIVRNRVSPVGVLHLNADPLDAEELLRNIEVSLRRKRHRGLQRLRVIAPPLFVFLAFLAVWEMSCKLLGVPEYVLPSPAKIAATILADPTSLLFDTGLTTLEALLGFLLANILSLLVAIAFCHSRWMETSFYPYTIALKSVPVVAVAPLLVLWFGYGLWGKVVRL